jgi:hypothetical protein
MPKIVICHVCKNAHWEDKQCQTCETKSAMDDARTLGAGYLRINPDGSSSRIDPRDIYIEAQYTDK